MSVHFVEITPENWRVFNQLKVKERQDMFVASNVVIMARAFVFRNDNSQVYGICYDDLPVGLLMQRDYKEDGVLLCVLDQFMIAEQYQGKSFGKRAMQLWLSMIKKEVKYDSISLCYSENDLIARSLYLSLGFRHTGKEEDDEIIMEYKLK